MISYILKRVMLFVPTLLVIVVISFFLFNYSNQNKVTHSLIAKGLLGDDKIRLDYDQIYIEEAIKLKVNQPPFYFSIVPNYYPNNINELIYPQKISQAKILLSNTQNWLCVKRYFNAIDRYTMAYKKISSDSINEVVRTSHQIVHRATNWNEFSELKALTFPADINNPLLNYEQEVAQSVHQLESASSFYWPTYKFYGSENQFHNWLSQFIAGNWGHSNKDGRPIKNIIQKALPWTFTMVIISIVFSFFLSLIFSLAMVLLRNTWVEYIINGSLYFLYAIPVFWLATIMVIFFTTDEYGSWTNLFPSIGINPIDGKSTFELIWNNFNRLWLPLLCITLHSLAYLSRQMRSSILQEMSQPYYTSAIAKGLSSKVSIVHHVLPNAMIPIVTILIDAIPSAFAGSVVIEVIFNIPGMGRILYDAIFSNDWSIIASILILIAIVTMICYLVGDILYSYLNPKIELAT